MRPNTSFDLLIVLCLLINSCSGQMPAQDKQIKLICSIPLPHVNGRIDHMSFNTKDQLIYVAALGNNSIEVVDLKNRKHIYGIKNLAEPQGVIYLPETNMIFVANGDNGECSIFNAETYQKKASLKLSGDADNVRYDEGSNKIYVGYGNGGIAIIDPVSFKIIETIKLEGHPESFQIDHTAYKIYVNVPDQKQIEIIDLALNKVIDKWNMKEASSNYPMCIDEANHRLFIGCRHPSKLLVLNTQTGKTISSYPIESDVDDIFYDNKTRQIYLSCGEGFVDIFKQTDPDTYHSNAKISTHSGARTSLFIPELAQLIVASPSGFNSEAFLLVYQIK